MIEKIEQNKKGDYELFEDKRWSKKMQQLVFRHQAAYSLFKNSEGTSFLDIGCGDGVFEEFVKSEHPEVVCAGIDLSETAIATAKEKVSGVEFIARDVLREGIPYPDNSFDVVIALDVLEHVFNPEILLSEMKRVAKHHVIIGVPNFSSFPSRVQMLFGRVPENNRPKKGHVYWFTRDILASLLTSHGLKISKFETNHQLAKVPFFGTLLKFLARIFPNLFALSFVALAKKVK